MQSFERSQRKVNSIRAHIDASTRAKKDVKQTTICLGSCNGDDQDTNEDGTTVPILNEMKEERYNDKHLNEICKEENENDCLGK